MALVLKLDGGLKLQRSSGDRECQPPGLKYSPTRSLRSSMRLLEAVYKKEKCSCKLEKRALVRRRPQEVFHDVK